MASFSNPVVPLVGAGVALRDPYFLGLVLGFEPIMFIMMQRRLPRLVGILVV